MPKLSLLVMLDGEATDSESDTFFEYVTISDSASQWMNLNLSKFYISS